MSEYQSQNEPRVYRLGEPMEAALIRLMNRDRALLDLMGGVFPERLYSMLEARRVLDIACGSGMWAVRAAYEYPHIQVIGVERSHLLVEHATGLAQARGVNNARFLLWTDAVTRLPFLDQSFDLVHASSLFNLVPTQEWPSFIQECLRLTRPGGVVCLIEPEWGLTDSEPLERLEQLFVRSLRQAGYGLSPDGRHLGVGARLPFLLQQAGAAEVTRQAFVLDYFLASPLDRNPAPHVEALAQMLQPPILEQGLASQQEIAHLLQEATRDVGREDFYAVVFVLAVCGRKACQ